MIVVKNRNERDRSIDRQSRKLIRQLMQEDAPQFFRAKNCPTETWIARTIFYKKKIHDKTSLKHGFYLRYKFRKNEEILDDVYDIGIIEIKIPESVDELLDLILMERERKMQEM